MGIIGFLVYQNYQLRNAINQSQNQNIPIVTPTLFQNNLPIETQQITPELNEDTSSSTLFLSWDVARYDKEGHMLNNFPFVNIVIEFPKEVIVSKTKSNLSKQGYGQLVSLKGTTYEVTVSAGGLCPWENDGGGCTYEDEPFENGTLRLWRDNNRGIFALNFQSLNINSYYCDHFEILKAKPTESFSSQDISFWKEWVKKAKTIPSEV